MKQDMARYVAEAIAKLRDTSVEEVAKHTFENTMRHMKSNNQNSLMR